MLTDHNYFATVKVTEQSNEPDLGVIIWIDGDTRWYDASIEEREKLENIYQILKIVGNPSTTVQYTDNGVQVQSIYFDIDNDFNLIPT